MNTRDLEWLDAWRHRRLSEDEFAELQDRLRADAGLRAALRSLAESGRPSLLGSRANPPLMEPMPAL